MNEIILKINQTYTIFESDKLHSELRILDWILYQVYSNELKQILVRLTETWLGNQSSPYLHKIIFI
jgi:hypothetical protein